MTSLELDIAGVRFTDFGERSRAHDEILTPEALAFVADLQRRFGTRRAGLLRARSARQSQINAGAPLSFLADTEYIRRADWTVAEPAPGLVDRDTLTEAWGDGILKALPARAKALFSAGRFVSVDDQGAHFALPNVAHRDRCIDMAPTVEQKLTAHFGTPVKLVLDVDDASAPATTPAPPPASSSGSSRSADSAGPPQDEPEAEVIDPAEYADNGPHGEGDQASEAHARLLEAFPGASEVIG